VHVQPYGGRSAQPARTKRSGRATRAIPSL
jgi:hypothetical protein